MPELPEVETVRRGLAPVMVGRRLEHVEQRRPDLRFPFPDRFVERLEGQTITGLSRRAKYLLVGLSSDEVLVMHLGMSGRFSVATPETDLRPGVFHHAHGGVGSHDHVVLHLSGDARVTYNDARRFGFMDLLPADGIETSRHFAGLGIEPLGGELSGERLAELFSGRRAPLKAALLDQRLVAGLGNIYVCEALHRAGLHPEAPASSIATARGRPREAAHRLAKEIRDVLLEAVEAGGSTLRDHAQVDGTLGYFQHRFRVYDRLGEPCTTPGCAGTIARIVQAGRSTFLCASCQPLPRQRG
ncbi:bifunctional DNA-formamidopyrimidine glycosylase/DNA-(apurinic or apyrimidinic site) lyase [Microvirga massiliensis]|uniref:bifunctional DNA-formamidopyrimidine glycosylase/DNA-(apurinic or apyrimidinic site) lyase n=1 Tax=Microvirga massiliensis TaxID=1033741 RepID=UPI00062B5AEF|nr:bifunctional DNA-formamidopyrimidine glycosylase/DNA-(apurinic or apyrimidinic site) lyase [Microvirga massiliensis]